MECVYLTIVFRVPLSTWAEDNKILKCCFLQIHFLWKIKFPLIIISLALLISHPFLLANGCFPGCRMSSLSLWWLLSFLSGMWVLYLQILMRHNPTSYALVEDRPICLYVHPICVLSNRISVLIWYMAIRYENIVCLSSFFWLSLKIRWSNNIPGP